MVKTSFLRRIMYSSFPLVLTAHAGAAFAQTTVNQETEAQVKNTDETKAAGPTTAGEIIVTAERRSVSLQRAPAAISVVSGVSLSTRGIQDIAQLTTTLPSVSIGKTAVGTRVFLRGVGQRFDSANTEPLVAVNFNGVGVLREALGGSNLYDVARIEGLPGPQGTLYGNTAVGGVINVQFNRPEYHNEGSIEVERANFDALRLTGVANIGSNSAALRLAVNYNKADSFLRSGAGRVDDFSGRLSGQAKLGNAFTAFVWGQVSRIRGTTVSSVVFPYVGDPYDDTRGNPGGTAGPPGAAPAPPARLGNLLILAGDFSYELSDRWTVSYLPSYLKNRSKTPFNFLNSTFDIQSKTREFANELRLTNGSASPLQLIGGLYQSNQKYEPFVAIRIAPIGGVTQFNVNIPYSRRTNLSAYAQAIYSVTDALRLTGGFRYGVTKRHAIYDTTERGRRLVLNNVFERKYKNADWKFGVEYDLSPTNLIYAVAQTGYAPGTYSIVPPASNAGRNDVDPTSLTAYTAGIKNRFFNRKVTLNLEGFSYDYRDLQISQINATSGVNQFTNAQKVRIYGFQLDGSVAIARHTEVHGQLAYLHARNVKFITPNGANFSGLEPVYSPKWTANIGASQTFPIAASSELVFRADSHLETGSWGQFDHRPGTNDVGLSSFNPGYRKTDASLTFEGGNGKYHIGAFVRNLENKARVASVNSVTSTLAGGFPELPRTYGVVFGAGF